ncbi:hypothetical protein C2E20_8719 [Micractinium conductrix]|uniref:Uncharacterized protein n=1 Tax=Micractinium conductrix TaxID=554055 RepID=A0A2P6V0M6_9CHLO|nr:hypothetical protein C2E20_8719 [Micractinium conductrix]|eukprot:PSC67639.1 hypothetical protein C2E20_8719 [Micractinium conductrix]
MVTSRGVIALLALFLAVGAAAQECDAALGELRSKLAAAEASGSSCTADAAGIKAKLEEAEASLAVNRKALADVEAKLQACPDGKAAEAAAAAAKASLAAAERQLEEATAKLKASEGQAATLKAAVEAAEAQAAAARSQHDSCSAQSKEAATKLAAAQSSQAGILVEIASLKAELARATAEAASAKAALSQVESAWLPLWAERAGRTAAATLSPAAQSAREYAEQGVSAAAALWSSHGKPAVERGVAVATAKAGELNAVLDKKLGDSWLKYKAQAAAAAGVAGAKAAQAWDAARTAALAAWHSDALAAVRPALAKGAAVASEQARKVQGELEEMLIRLLSKNNSTVPLARRPYVTYMVYGGVFVPLVAFGMPLLGLRCAPKPRVGESRLGGAPMSTKKKKKPVRLH